MNLAKPISSAMAASVAERFWSKVHREHRCWLWRAHKRNGYGILRVSGKDHAAHRISWAIGNSTDVPAELDVLHRCNNPSCVNPAHLYLGTHADNMKDRVASGRDPHAAQTHCVHGHEFTEANTIRRSSGGRRCAICTRNYRSPSRLRAMARYALLVAAASSSIATATVTGEWRINLVKSSTTIETIKGAEQQATWAACNTKALALSGSTHILHKCQTPLFVATWTADPPPPPPVCPPMPLVESRTAQCPTGQTGSWTQTRSYASVAAPTCWLAGNWVPVNPPTGACTVVPPPPPVLSTPTLSAVRTANTADPSRYNVNLSWTVSQNATTYSAERCAVALPAAAPCTNFAGLQDAGQLTTLGYLNNNLPAGYSYSYRVRGRDGALNLSSAWSNVVTVETPVVTPPPPTTGVAPLNWTPSTQNTDGSTLVNLSGYRIFYSPMGIAGPTLDQQIDVNSPAVLTYAVDKLAPGTWCFAVAQRTSDGKISAKSNFVTRVIP